MPTKNQGKRQCKQFMVAFSERKSQSRYNKSPETIFKSYEKILQEKENKRYDFPKKKGALPSNLLEMANADNKSKYLQACRKLGKNYHPARFPTALPEFFIKFLTDENDLVVDIFGGSNTTGYAAENLGRRWKTFEMSPEYVATSAFRFISDIANAQLCYDTILNSDTTVDLSPFQEK